MQVWFIFNDENLEVRKQRKTERGRKRQKETERDRNRHMWKNVVDNFELGVV